MRIVLRVSCERYEVPAVQNRVLHVLIAVLVGIYKLVCTVKGLERAACIVADCRKSFLAAVIHANESCAAEFSRCDKYAIVIPLKHGSCRFVLDVLVGRRGVSRTVVVSVTVRVHARCFDFLMRTNDTFLFYKVFVRQLIWYILLHKVSVRAVLAEVHSFIVAEDKLIVLVACAVSVDLFLAVCFKRIHTFINRERRFTRPVHFVCINKGGDRV